MNNPTPDQIEEVAAAKVVHFANFLANHDKDIATAIVWQAFDLLTADLSTARKRALILGEME
jgi:hypothetical protein